MIDSSDSELFAEIESLDDFILATNQALEAAVMNESNRAFNLGLRTWLIPGGLTVIAVFVLSKANWAMTGIAAALIGLATLVFALFVASRSKAKSPARIYENQLSGVVQYKLNDLGQSPETFATRTLEILPTEALLVHHFRGLETDPLIHKPSAQEEVE